MSGCHVSSAISPGPLLNDRDPPRPLPPPPLGSAFNPATGSLRGTDLRRNPHLDPSQASFPQPHLTPYSPAGASFSSSSPFIPVSLQLSPSLCPLERVLISPHPGSSLFSFPFSPPGTLLGVPTPLKLAPPLPVTLFPFVSIYPIPVPTAPQKVFLTLTPHPSLQTLFRSPYFPGVTNIPHLCSLSPVLSLSQSLSPTPPSHTYLPHCFQSSLVPISHTSVSST